MDSFRQTDLDRLVDATEGPFVSIYMPTYRAGREVLQNATRFKNLVHRVREEADERFPEADGLHRQLKELAKRVDDEDWWQHQSDGLAVFVSADQTMAFRVPLKFEETTVMGDRFELRPMIQLRQGDGHFYILAVSQNRVRLLAGTQYSVDDLEPEQLPTDLRSALNIDEYVSTLQQHSTGGAAQSGGMTFHGQGGSDPDNEKKDEIQQFFHRINRSLVEYLGPGHTPLVFAGVDYLFPLFQKVCHYPGLVKRAVTGNPDELKPEALHDQAWKLVAPLFAQRQADALEQIQDAAANAKATAQLNEIVPACRQGAVATLLIAEGEVVWGTIDEATGRCEVTEASVEGAVDLLNDAAAQTLKNGGTVFCVAADQLPDGQPAAALLRRPLTAAY